MNNESIDSIDTEPSWGKLSISYWLALLVGLALIGLGVNGLIQPSVAAEAFGLPLSSSLDSVYVRVKAGRDLIVGAAAIILDRKSTRLNSSHVATSYAVFCLKKKNTIL